MKKNILNKLIICLLLFAAFGCRTRKPVTPVVVASPTSVPSEASTPVNTTEILGKIGANQIKYNSLNLKAKADLSINNNSNSVTMNIRMQHAKVIWISVSAPIIGEVARALITPDSIKIINKLEDTYTRKPFSYIYQYANKQITFQSLQGLFIGNAFEGTLTPQSTVKVNGGQTQVSGKLTDLTYLLIFDESYRLLQSNLADKNAGQSLSANYGEHKEYGGYQIPYAISLSSAVSNKGINVDLHYNQISLNETLDFPFSVPKRYTIKD